MSAPTIDLAMVLTRREAEILDELLKDGATNAVIAKRLFITEDTVKSHMKSLLNKGKKKHRAGLIVAVMRDELKFLVRPTSR